VVKNTLGEEPFGLPFKDLVDRCFSICLHRLRGVRGLLSGWIEIGVPEGEQHRVHQRMDEDLLLLGRLDWLRSLLHHAPPRQRVLLGEAPAVFLACALGMGTPEEAGDRLPKILQPEAALALSLWLQIRSQAFDAASIRFGWKGNCLEVTLASVNDADLSTWSRLYGEWVVESEPHRLLMCPGAFAPQQATQVTEQG
jgi:hypothetical protein